MFQWRPVLAQCYLIDQFVEVHYKVIHMHVKFLWNCIQTTLISTKENHFRKVRLFLCNILIENLTNEYDYIGMFHLSLALIDYDQ